MKYTNLLIWLCFLTHVSTAQIGQGFAQFQEFGYFGTLDVSNRINMSGPIYLLGSSDLRGGSDKRVNIYSNTNSINSRAWIEMHPNTSGRAGELTLAGTYLDFRTNSTTTSEGSVAMRLTAEGNLGVRATAPDRPLTIKGSGDNVELISLRNASGTNKWHLNFFGDGLNFVESHVADHRLFLQEGGRVGIGLGNPQTRLDVAGDLQTRNALNPNSFADHLRISTSSTRSIIETQGDDEGLYLKSNTGNQIFLQGKVGLNTDALEPGFDITVNGHTYIGNFHPDSLIAATVNDTLLDSYYLWVEKGIVSENYAIAHIQDWSDYVLENDHQLVDLDTIHQFIKKNKHLPGVPSQAELIQSGYNIHEMNKVFMAKIEELMLYTIMQDQEIKSLRHEMGLIMSGKGEEKFKSTYVNECDK